MVFYYAQNKWLLKIIVEVRLRCLIILKTYLLCTYHIAIEMISIITQTKTQLKTDSFLPCESLKSLLPLHFLSHLLMQGVNFAGPVYEKNYLDPLQPAIQVISYPWKDSENAFCDKAYSWGLEVTIVDYSNSSAFFGGSGWEVICMTSLRVNLPVWIL